MLLSCWLRLAFAERARDGVALGRGTAAAALLTLVSLGGCAQSPQQLAAVSHPKEYFPSSVYGPASRRVIADGQPVPHGGGQYLVGKPYTVAGQTYYPSERKITQVGLASWYGDAFHGRLTANGEIYDRDGFTAAHPTMPLPSYARVTNLRNNHSMIVRVNDRGPYHANRIMDVSKRVAEALDFQQGGTSKVKVEYVGRASLAGSDNSRLYATLRQDGPARIQGVEATTAVASTQAPVARVASLSPEVPQPEVGRRRDEDSRAAELERYRAPRTEPSASRKAVLPPKATAESPQAPPSRRGLRLASRSAPVPMAELPASMPRRRDAETSRREARELTALIRADHKVAVEPKAGVFRPSEALFAKNAAAVTPPVRPTRLAAAGPVRRHDGAGLRGPHPKDN